MAFTQKAIFTRLCPDNRCVFCNRQFEIIELYLSTCVKCNTCPGIMTIYQLGEKGLTDDEFEYVIDKWFPKLRPAADEQDNVVDIQVDVEAEQVALEGDVGDELENAVGDEQKGAVDFMNGNFGTTDTVNGVGTSNQDAELEKEQPEKMKPEETAGTLDIVIKGVENLLNKEE
ncbi:hypothetical protein Ocin01_13330 [Orchesella cincta]|uniref:Uncharacterized protein n=1 Tax=Orchesella cincta TaxID=48709 RepID=A0A1D2MK18_ORCCI|nr:hypothetical protein Ocin01_13330 [Orchesella cincta]